MGSCLDQRGRLSNYKSMHEFFYHTASGDRSVLGIIVVSSSGYCSWHSDREHFTIERAMP